MRYVKAAGRRDFDAGRTLWGIHVAGAMPSLPKHMTKGKKGGECCAFIVVQLPRWGRQAENRYKSETWAASAAGTEWHIRQRASYESAAPTMIVGEE